MRVFMTSTSYPQDFTDWRGRFIYNLVSATGKRPELTLRLWAPRGKLPECVEFAATESEVEWLNRLSATGGIAHLLRTRPFRGAWWGIGLLRQLRHAYRRESQCDVIHVNWLQAALPLLGISKPLVVSVLGSDLRMLRLPGLTTLLRLIFRQRKTIIAPNASWMAPFLEKHFGDVAEICVVPFGVDDAWFDIDRAQHDSKLWITVTRVTKGKIGSLFEWGEGLFDAERQLHLFGPMQERLALPPWIIYHGPTHPTALIESWFPRAAGLITLSQHDEGRPQVMLEAMASGLPIIASDLAAHRDIISHRQIGWIAHSRETFGEGLNYLANREVNLAVGNCARQWVKKAIGTWDDCASLYATLYRRVQGHGS